MMISYVSGRVAAGARFQRRAGDLSRERAATGTSESVKD
jgi:hypothetical protein